MTDDFTAAEGFLRLFTVSVYISLQLRTEKEEQTPVIETSQQIPIVPVRARRSVPAGVCVCVHTPARVCVCGSR